MDPDCAVTVQLKRPLDGIIIGLPYRQDALIRRGKVVPCNRGLSENKAVFVFHMPGIGACQQIINIGCIVGFS